MSWCRLCPNLWSELLRYLSPLDWGICRRVCRDWRMHVPLPLSDFAMISQPAEIAFHYTLSRAEFGLYAFGSAVCIEDDWPYSTNNYGRVRFCEDCTVRAFSAGKSLLAAICQHGMVFCFHERVIIRCLPSTQQNLIVTSPLDDSVYYVRQGSVCCLKWGKDNLESWHYRGNVTDNPPFLFALNHTYRQPLFGLQDGCVSHLSRDGCSQFPLEVSPVHLLMAMDSNLIVGGQTIKLFDPSSAKVVSQYPYTKKLFDAHGVRFGRQQVIVGQGGGAVLYDLRCSKPQCIYTSPHFATNALYISDDCLLSFQHLAHDIVLWDVRRPNTYMLNDFGESLHSAVQMQDGSIIIGGSTCTYYYRKLWK